MVRYWQADLKIVILSFEMLKHKHKSQHIKGLMIIMLTQLLLITMEQFLRVDQQIR